MEKAPTISVLMSVYKEPQAWVRDSVESILNQTFTNFEFIIVCDNPNYEEGIELLKNYAQRDNRIKLLFNIENIGLTKSLNKGLALAKGKYIARMDADDISMPKRFEKQVAFMDSNTDVIVLGTNCRFIGEKSWLHHKEPLRKTDEDIRAQMLYGNCLIHSSVLIRHSVLINNNIRYDENYLRSQDLRLWEQLLPLGLFANFSEPLVKYRLSNQQITNTDNSKQREYAMSVRYRLIRDWLKRSGLSYSENDIKDNPLLVLSEIKRNKEIRNTKEFKAFVQFIYFKALPNYQISDIFKGRDFLYFSPVNIIRLFVKKL